MDVVRTAQQAPSWVNSQPWRVYAATGATLAGIKKRHAADVAAGRKGNADLPVKPRTEWSATTQENMTALGEQISTQLGEGVQEFQASQGRLFNAQAALYVTIPVESTPWSFHDLGAFSAMLVLAAADKGLGAINAYALVFALTVGVAYNAIPEEITLRRTLFSPIHERFGAAAAVLMTTASFTALHLPTWLTSDTSLKGYAWQILHKVLFGLLAGWSVVRRRSMFFALGLHVSGNTLGLFIGQLQSENLPDFELSWLNAAILLTGAAAVASLIFLLGRRVKQPSVLSP